MFLMLFLSNFNIKLNIIALNTIYYNSNTLYFNDSFLLFVEFILKIDFSC